MVGTTRFELATSPTPRVRSTRLSHVPTIGCTSAQAGDGGVCCRAKCTRTERTSRRPLLGRSDKFLGQRTALAEEEFVHLLDQKLLRLACPGLQTVLIQQHLLALHPLAPGLFGDVFVDLLAEV